MVDLFSIESLLVTIFLISSVIYFFFVSGSFEYLNDDDDVLFVDIKGGFSKVEFVP